MTLGALLDAGLPLDDLKRALGSLALGDAHVHVDRVLRAGVSAAKFSVHEHGGGSARHVHDHDHHDHAHGTGHAAHGTHDHAHRTVTEIFALIDTSALTASAREKAKSMFKRLAEAEAAIHQMPIEQVHLHEVGALDSIIDIVGVAFAMEWAGADRVVSSPLNVGGGMVHSAHGHFPVPAPATVKLLGNTPVYSGPVQKELVTPTGALIATTYASAFGPLPAMSVERVGYGAGDRDEPSTPNVLRVLIGEETAALKGCATGTTIGDAASSTTAGDAASSTTLGDAASSTTLGDAASVAQAFRPAGDVVTVVECEIDDMNPQIFGVVMDRLYGAGALEVFYVPVQMKKNRPGTLLTAIAPPEKRAAVTDVIFRETTTIGLRHYDVQRECLTREIVAVTTPIGDVRFKVASRNGRVLNAAPEFDDCAALAAKHNLSVKEVQAIAIRAFQP